MDYNWSSLKKLILGYKITKKFSDLLNYKIIKFKLKIKINF